MKVSDIPQGCDGDSEQGGMPMRTLILSVTAGQGHNNYFRSIGAEVETLDAFDCINKIIAKTISKGYDVSTKIAAKQYEQVYTHYEKRSKTADDITTVRVTNTFFASKLKKFIDAYAPDAIVCTHVFAAAIVDILKVKGELKNVKVYGIVTDFVLHPFWEEAVHIDYLVTPSELLNLQAYKKGYKKNQILPIGIPIDPKFSKEAQKSSVRRSLGLDPQKFTVLFMSGSMGYGDVAGVVKSLDNIKIDFQMIVVCGNNADAKKKIDELELNKKVLNYGYVNNVDTLMDAADCIITKPGGLTTSEALAKNLPMIIANPIPGQETRNTEFLLNNGCAMYVSPTGHLDEIIYQFFYFSDREENMRRAISLIRHPNSTKELCTHIIKSCGK